MTPDDSFADGEPRIRCWACAELVHPDARKCRWCGEWFAELADRARASGATATEVASSADATDQHEASRADGDAATLLRTDAFALEVSPAGLDQVAADNELRDRLDEVRR